MLTVFRRVLGAALVIESLVLWYSPHGLVHAASPYGHPEFNLKHPFRALDQVHIPQHLLHVATTVVAALGTLLGLLPRGAASTGVVAALACAAWSTLWLTESSLYNNHYYLYSSILFLFSIPARPAATAAAIRLQLAIVYVYAGIAKLDPDWLSGAVPAGILAHPDRQWVVWLFGRHSHRLLGFGGLLVDLGSPILWSMPQRCRAARALGLSAAAAFHFGNLALFGISGIGAFSLVMLAGLLLEKPPWGSSRRQVYYVTRGSSSCGAALRAVAVVWLALQCIAPAVPAVLEGPSSSWTKLNDRFRWRMKSTVETMSIWLPLGGRFRKQVALCRASVITPSDDDEHVPWFLPDLNPAQREAVCSRPYAAAQYARHLRNSDVGAVDVRITAWHGLNYYPLTPRFNSSVNLVNIDIGSTASAVIPFSRKYGAFDPVWRPVWQGAVTRFAAAGLGCVEFFSLGPDANEQMPWFEGPALPAYIELFDGAVMIRLQLPSGVEREVYVAAAAHEGGVGGSQTAQFPPSGKVLHWTIQTGGSGAFFALVWWRGEKQGDEDTWDRFSFLRDFE